MKGINTLTLNSATVIEALQEYFDRRTVVNGQFDVTAIGFAGNGEYRITCTAKEQLNPVPKRS